MMALRIFAIIGSILCAVFCSYSISAAAVCLTCDPQCVKYVRDHSGIQCHGNAETWSSCAAAKHTDKPETGNVIVLSAPAHVIYVTRGDNKCKDHKCSIKISHSNWSNGCACGPAHCCVEENVSAKYDMKKKELHIEGGRLPGVYKVSSLLRK